MVSKKMVSDKHALTVRVSDDDYRKIRKAAEREDMSANEWIAKVAVLAAIRKE